MEGAGNGNDNKNYRRVNMTFLHEIGHCVLGYSEKMDPMRAKAGQVIEPKVRDFVSKALNIKFKD